MTDVVFGPALTHGTYSCPDCHAGAGFPCTEDCPRRRIEREVQASDRAADC